MVFSSILFLFRFFPVFMILYFLAPGRMKNFILFLGSLVFYAWGEPVYLFLMLFCIAANYGMALKISACQENKDKKKKKVWFLFSVFVDVGLLGFFKYTGLASLPIGISFYTFQILSYMADVYRGESKAEKNLITFGAYVTMFPQLIAGPIVPYKTVKKELKNRRLSAEKAAYGCRRFILGLGKKVLLANQIGMLWDTVSVKPAYDIPFFMAWMGISAFAFQIYFDFSGYSDMAVGLGAILGFDFPENFNYPYISRSITEFWRRWHISLGSWFRDYVYIPLGGNRKGLQRQIVNLIIVWSLTGIWHGAGINFLMWGLWFCIFLIAEKLFLFQWLGKCPAVVGWLYASFIVLVGWSIFEADSLLSLTAFLSSMFAGNGWVNRETMYLIHNYKLWFAVLALASTPLPKKWAQYICSRWKLPGIVLEKIALAFVLFLSVACLVGSTYNPFLYFQF